MLRGLMLRGLMFDDERYVIAWIVRDCMFIESDIVYLDAEK
jgi:hypothetical protein